MANGQFGPVVRQIERLFTVGSVVGLDEDELLERFLRRKDEAAFGALVARHGPMVLGVCRRWLDDPNDVDDAFQATFLVLVRKASSLHRRDLLANWLYGVALRVASRARTASIRARSLGRGVEALADAGPAAPEPYPWLHEEVSRLPAKYRAPIVLCYLEGLTHEEAAEQLGCPLGTVKGRLARARDLLRTRLSRRGLALPSAGVVALLGQEASATVPPLLAEATTRAALALAAGRATAIALISLPVATLYQGTLHAMSLSKLKLLAVPTALVGTFVAGASVLADPQNHDDRSKEAAGTASSSKVKEVEPAANVRSATSEATANLPVFFTAAIPRSMNPNSRKSAQSQVEMAREALRILETGQLHSDPEKIDQWSLRLMHAQASLASTPEERVAAYAEHLERMKQWEGVYSKAEQDSTGPGRLGRVPNRLEWQFRRSQAEQLLAEVKGESIPRKTAKPAVAAIPSEAARPAEASTPADPARPAEAANPARAAESARPLSQDSARRMMMGDAQNPMGGMQGRMARVNYAGTKQFSNEVSMRIAELMPKVEGADKTPKTQEILKALNEPITMSFAKETPLEDVLKYIRSATAGPNDSGIPIYVDPVGLKHAGVEMTSPVTLELEGVPMKTSLRLILKQVGLAYCVREGLLIISSVEGVLQELKEFESTHPEMNLDPQRGIQ